MKIIFVLRHSKAVNNFLSSDHDRALTDRGKADSKKVATKIVDLEIDFDLVLASTATRVVETLADFSSILQINPSKIKYLERMYNAPHTEYYNQIKNLDKNVTTLMVVAHNPGITNFINSLGIVSLDHMPTTGLFGFTSACMDWQDFENSKKEFLYFEQPAV